MKNFTIFKAVLALALVSGAMALKAFRRSGSSGDNPSEFDENPNPKLALSPIWNLQSALMDGYIPTVRPVLSPSDVVNVSINLILFNLIDLVSKSYHDLECTV